MQGEAAVCRSRQPPVEGVIQKDHGSRLQLEDSETGLLERCNYIGMDLVDGVV